MSQDGRRGFQKDVGGGDLCDQGQEDTCHPGVRDYLLIPIHATHTYPFPIHAKLQPPMSQLLQAAAIDDIDNASSTVKSWKSRTMLGSKVDVNKMFNYPKPIWAQLHMYHFIFKIQNYLCDDFLRAVNFKFHRPFDDKFRMVVQFQDPMSVWKQLFYDGSFPHQKNILRQLLDDSSFSISKVYLGIKKKAEKQKKAKEADEEKKRQEVEAEAEDEEAEEEEDLDQEDGEEEEEEEEEGQEDAEEDAEEEEWAWGCRWYVVGWWMLMATWATGDMMFPLHMLHQERHFGGRTECVNTHLQSIGFFIRRSMYTWGLMGWFQLQGPCESMGCPTVKCLWI